MLTRKTKYNIFPQDLYQKFLDCDLEENIPKEEDPFWEPPEPVLIGTANAYLQVFIFVTNADNIMPYCNMSLFLQLV